MKSINKEYKSDVVQIGTSRIVTEKIPFSSPRLNYMTYGGIPVGMVTELFGEENGGKTTTALDVVKNAQKRAKDRYETRKTELETEIEELVEKGNKSDKKKIDKLQEELESLEDIGIRKVVYVDAENTLDEDWAKTLGVDTDHMILVRPLDQTAEQVLQIILDLIKSGGVELVVLDSIPMLVPQLIYSEDMDKKSFGGVSGVLTDFCKRLPPLLTANLTTFIGINQKREDLTNPYNIYKTAGGRGWKHACALRLYMRKGDLLDESGKPQRQSYDKPVGNQVDVTIVKTKVCKPDRRVGFYTLNYTSGVDAIADTIEVAILYDIIKTSGSYFYIMDEDGEVMEDIEGNKMQFQGRAKLIECLKEDEYLFEEIRDRTQRKLMEV